MVDTEEIKNKILNLLTENAVEYKIYEHRPILYYADAEEVQKETGWEGTEGKSLVLKTDNEFIVYVTIQGKKVNFDAIKQIVGAKKVRLASTEELKENFGAIPGCAYPFSFDKKFVIYVDPAVYEQEWFLFSPAVPTFTVQAKAAQLKDVFSHLENKVIETTAFNL